MSEELYDVIILGGGPAGLTAGIYTSRQGLNTLLFEGKQLGGRAWGPHRIENYPGFPEGITGTELIGMFVGQANKFGVEIKAETVVGLTDMGDAKMVLSRGGVYRARTVIIATGLQRKQLSIPGEQEFKGRGVSYCAICDGPFFADQVVAVVGSGKDAVEDILRLSETAKKIYAIPGSAGYGNDLEGLEEMKERENVEIFEGVDPSSIEGGNVVSRITLENGPVAGLDVNGVFVILDSVGTADLVGDADVETDERGCIIVDKHQRTNLEGIFAAGECVCGGSQIVVAAGEGAKAGLMAFRYVRSMKK